MALSNQSKYSMLELGVVGLKVDHVVRHRQYVKVNRPNDSLFYTCDQLDPISLASSSCSLTSSYCNRSIFSTTFTIVTLTLLSLLFSTLALLPI